MVTPDPLAPYDDPVMTGSETRLDPSFIVTAVDAVLDVSIANVNEPPTVTPAAALTVTVPLTTPATPARLSTRVAEPVTVATAVLPPNEALSDGALTTSAWPAGVLA